MESKCQKVRKLVVATHTCEGVSPQKIKEPWFCSRPILNQLSLSAQVPAPLPSLMGLSCIQVAVGLISCSHQKLLFDVSLSLQAGGTS